MAAAKSLTAQEITKVLNYISTKPNALRNRTMFSITTLAGCRVSEVASMTIGDVLNADGTIKTEIYFSSDRVKHGTARTVFVNQRLQAELADYIASRV